MSSYETYLGHFFDGVRREIRQDRPDRVRDKLRNVEQLIGEVVRSNYNLNENGSLWNYILGEYVNLQRRAAERQNKEAEKRIIRSFYGVFLHTKKAQKTEVTIQSVKIFGNIYEQSLALSDSSEPADVLLDRFEKIKIWTFAKFEDAENEDDLNHISELINALLRVYAQLWKSSIEKEMIGFLGILEYHLRDIHQIRRYRYNVRTSIQESRSIDSERVEFGEEKQTEADRYRKEIDRLKFASYGWAFHLYQEEELSPTFLREILSTYLKDEFSSVSDLTELYFELLDTDQVLRYWEHWNMSHELENNHGAVTTHMAMNSWLFEFLCSSMVYILDTESDISGLENQSVEESPLANYHQIDDRVDKTINVLEDYKTNYPLAEFIDPDPDYEDRCAALVDYFEDIKLLVRENKKNWNRRQPISEPIVDKLAEKIDTQLNACALRSGIEEVGGISKIDPQNEIDTHEFTSTLTYSRSAFIDDDVSTVFMSNFTDLIDKYRRFIISRLDFEERVLESLSELPSQINDLESEHDVSIVVVEISDARRALRDDQRAEQGSSEIPNSFFNFVGIPVLEESTEEYAAIALFENGFEYNEIVNDYPISVNATPGEDVEEVDSTDNSNNNDVRDFVQVKATYRAYIESTEQNGVVFTI